MNILVDTHIVIWSLDANSPLKGTHREILKSTSNRIVASQFSLMEIAIKKNTGKLQELQSSTSEIANTWVQNGFELLPVGQNHILALEKLVRFAQHKDPFDRFIIATAIAEGFKVMTYDEKFHLYSEIISIV